MSPCSIIDTPFYPKNSKDNDKLGMDPYVDALTNFIKDSNTPLTIAIQGEWGSGKSSFINQISKKLCDGSDDSPTFFGIWVRAWEYALLSDPRDILTNMLQGIMAEIEKEVEKVVTESTTMSQVFHVARSTFFQVAAIGAQAAAAHAGMAPGALNGFLGNKEKKSSISALKEALNNVIQESLKGSRKKGKTPRSGFIFFIDDLDRLDPVIAVQFLELLKNIFDLENCIFVLAIDYDVVVKGLQPKFGKKTDENEREFRCFFDKIIQVPFNLPVSSYNLSLYLESILNSISFLGKSKGNPTQLGDAGSFMPGGKMAYSAMPIMVQLTKFSTGTNPRAIKRLVNTLSLIMKIQEAKQKGKSKEGDSSEFVQEEELILFALVSLQIAYPQFYRLLSNIPGFTSWNADLADQRGYPELDKKELEDLQKRNEFNEEWELFIYRACEKFPYLRASSNNISSIFNILRGIILHNNLPNFYPLDSDQITPETRVESAIRKYIGLAAITGINSESSEEKKQWNKVDTYSNIEEYHDGLDESFRHAVPLLKEVISFLEEKCGRDSLVYDFKSNGEVKIRPRNLAKYKGQKPNLMTLRPFSDKAKNTKGNQLKLECEAIYESSLQLPDDFALFKKDWPQFRDLYNNLASVPLPDDDQAFTSTPEESVNN